MVNDDFSCIKEVTKVVQLTLPSMYNTNEISGICDALESWKRQYVKQLQGIVVGFKNVSLTSKRGFIKVDCPVIFCNVKATFEVFYPTIGSVIKGKINRISQDHIGCLVHGTINVTLHRTADESSDVSKFIALDNFILFKITRINFKSKFIHVKGKITEECVATMQTSSLFNHTVEKSDNNELTCSFPDFCDDPVTPKNNTQVTGNLDTSTDTSSQTSSHKKKKKHKKSKESFLMSPSLLSESLENNIDQVELNPSLKRKRKKSDNSISPSNALENETAAFSRKKIKTEEFNTTDVNQMEFTQYSDDIGNLDTSTDNFCQTSSHKKKKKHKKSKESFSMSPSLKSESLENDIDQVQLTQSRKRKRKRSDASSTSSSSVLENETAVFPKKKIKIEEFNTALVNEMEFYQSFDNPSPPQTPQNSHIKSEQESLTSPDLFDKSLKQEKLIKSKKKKKKDNVSDKSKPKKKKDKLKKGSKKDKLKEGSKKDKLKEGSKKDKKKKIKVISTKKKLHGHNSKLKKKKNKDKKSKLTKKNKMKK